MRRHIPALDGVRAMAALMVMWFHYWGTPGHLGAGRFDALLGRFNTLGQSGVDLFFVLSGFLITRILWDARGKDRYFLNFYMRRSLRILPLYYGFLCLSVFVLPWCAGEAVPAAGQHWWWWVYLQNIPVTFGIAAIGPGHYWSLAVEEHFYLFWPLLVCFLSRRTLVRVCLGLVALAMVLRVVMLANGIGVFYFTFTRLDALSLGALLALVEPEMLAQRVKMHRRFLWGLFAIGAPLAVLYTVLSGTRSDWLQATKFLFIGLWYFAFIGLAVTAEENSLLNRMLASRPMRFIGGISYGLYVYHGTCFHWIDRLFPHGHHLLFLPPIFSVVVLIAWLSFRFFETPFLRLKKWFEPRTAPQAAKECVLV